MKFRRGARALSAPLSVQILGLLLGGLVVAQLVTFGLTVLLPPPAPAQYRLEDIAAALAGRQVRVQGGHPLVRTLRDAPPSLRSTGWLVSERSRHDLAGLLNAPEADVRLLFYSPLPFAGAGGGGLADAGGPAAPAIRLAEVDGAYAVRRVALLQGPQGGGGPPGMGGGFGGAGALGGGRVGGFGRASGEDDGEGRGFGRGGRGSGARSGGGRRGGFGGASGGARDRGEGASGAAPIPSAPATIDPPGSHNGAWLSLHEVAPQGVLGGPLPRTAPLPPPPQGGVIDRPAAGAGASIAVDGDGRGDVPQREARPAAPRPLSSPVIPQAAAPVAPAPAPAAAAPVASDSEDAVAGMGVIAPAPLVAARSGDTGGYLVHAPALQPRGLFGLAPAPFVQGDFVAAVRTGGRWATVQPQAEPFPNSWQRRVLLWFAAALAIVGPLGWLFARRLARPLDAFARAAERLGRDPSGAAVALGGPAEIGRAARAFNTMQARLKRFVDDRTAMVGAISHDLRTPLARMRFRMERAEPALRRAMLNDIGQMEEMISSVLVFIREASEPSLRERIDLRSILECVVDDAALLGGDAELQGGAALSVEADALGLQRVLANLVDNALKYGRRADVRLYAEGEDAVAEVHDDGPGLPPEELERVFQPFYRAEASRTLNSGGIGLGLAVSRSIARAHGGDVRLYSGGETGVVAQLRLPLAAASAGREMA